MNDARELPRLRRLLRRLLAVPENVAGYWAGKLAGWWKSSQLAEDATPLAIGKDAVRALRQAAVRYAGAGSAAHESPTASPEERALLESIRDETERFNRNNVTRTQAYWRVFERRPELHWAFLAHMVSRNGGWNMTDLKSELLSRLVSPARAEAIFAFLERANALIFQDAYPQLRLYEASLERKRELFRLLPAFGVSAFMRPVWEQFWRERNSALLTVALIVNEQHYIEGRVVQNETFRRTVLDTAAFQAQSLMQLNAVVFPYADAQSPGSSRRLAGLVLETFSDLRERIEFGKKLYAILFAMPGLAQSIRSFAAARPHTGSRADYWPHLFATVRKSPPKPGYAEKLDGCKLRPGAEPIFSPELAHAWKDVPVRPPERYDWFRPDDTGLLFGAFGYLDTVRPPASFEMTNEYCFVMNKLELAHMAGELLLE
ncbi:DUF2515 family protein [Paenibacillus flagellatus]|uniref:DUF2515 domain-containing protein n=1 Tax=Paenibacillus flagellatus TaxID=2211139 RepID=A0A2V5K3T6_9BACL|nr:DUF2515 family protein [Paenibacillus flagellatus]PYI53945.1 DUF2515 domain-containing protein [Paenibacillus flagellatus]